VDEITREAKVEFYDKLSEAVKGDGPTYLTLTRSGSGALKFEKTSVTIPIPVSPLERQVRLKAEQLGQNAVVRVKFNGQNRWEILD
jgi:hypothetical protein